jgi:hypothetical protein
MTIPLIPKPQFPSVPDVSGVPPIPRSPTVPAPSTTFAPSETRSLPADTTQRVWGIYDANNNPAIIVDSIMVVKPTNDAKVSSFPVEDGGFVSFNKVQTPYDVKVKVSLGGDLAAMSKLLDDLAALLVSVDLFSIVTPYEVYLNATLEKYDYSQEARRGANRIEAELSFKEVRTVTPQFTSVALPPSKVKKPGSASTQDSGKQQGQKTSVASKLVNGVSNWLKK